MTEVEIYKCFVESWTTDSVLCKTIGKRQIKEFDIHLFKDVKLFKGKNIWIEITIEHGSPTTIIAKRNELDKAWIVQLWNYYIIGNFQLPNTN